MNSIPKQGHAATGSDAAQAGAQAAVSTPSSPVTRFIFVRHGETAWNKIKRIQGQIDIGLSEQGRRQATLLAQRLSRRDEPYGPITAVVSSDLSRAMETAEPVAAALGCGVTPYPALRERHYGAFQGMDAPAIAARWPDEHARWVAHEPDFAPEGGESLTQLSARVITGVDALAARYPGRTVLCLTHGGVLDCIYRFVNGLPLSVPREWLLLNASVNVADWSSAANAEKDEPIASKHGAASASSSSARLLCWADVTHLASLAEVRDDS